MGDAMSSNHIASKSGVMTGAWAFIQKLGVLFGAVVILLLSDAAKATAVKHHATLNLSSGQPTVWVEEFESSHEVPTSELRLSAKRHWVPEARKGSLACTWGEHWCLAADGRLATQSDGSLALYDCCTGQLMVWNRVPDDGKRWHNPHWPGTKLTQEADRLRLQWGMDDTDRVDMYSADGRLLQQSKRSLPGSAPETITYHWAKADGVPTSIGNIWRVQRIQHSNGSALELVYAPGGHAVQLRLNGQTVRQYRYNSAGWLMQATDAATTVATEGKPAVADYRYTVRGQLVSWPGGFVKLPADGTATSDRLLPRIATWDVEGEIHHASERVSGNQKTVTHTWGLPAVDEMQSTDMHRLIYTRHQPGGGWKQTGLQVACKSGPSFTVRYDPESGRPLQWQSSELIEGNSEEASLPVTFSWGNDGVLQQLTIGSVRRIRFEYDVKGHWIAVRHEWIGNPVLGVQSAQPLPPDMRFGYDNQIGEMVDIELVSHTAGVKSGASRKGIRVHRDPKDPRRILRTVPYGGMDPFEVVRAYEAARLSFLSGTAEQATNLAAKQCSQ